MNFPKLGASQLSLGTQAGAQAVTGEPTDLGVPRRAAGPARRPGPDRLHAKAPASYPQGAVTQDMKLPVPGPTPDPALPFSPQTKREMGAPAQR